MPLGKGLGQIQHSVNNLFLETATMPPNVKDILNRRGDAVVNSIKIGRTPVQSAIQGILKTLSTVPYDDLFHLFMVFKTSKGEILFEKNARINASTTIPKSEDWYDLNDVPHLTLNDYIQNTKKRWDLIFFRITQIQIIVKISLKACCYQMESMIRKLLISLNKTLQ